MNNKNQNNVWRSTIGGSIGGGVEALLLHPLDTIKTRIQLSGMTGNNNRSNIPKGIVGCGKYIIKNEGFFSLYKGLTPFVTHLMTKYCLRYYVNFQLRKMISDKNGNTTTLQNILCGMTAGSIEALLIVTPFEVVKTRLQAQESLKLSKKTRKYKGPIHAVYRIISREGYKGLWKGCSPTVFRQASNQASMFTAYTWIRNNIWGNPDSLNPWQAGSSALVASTIGPLINCPADVIKTRLMNQRNSLLDPEFQYEGFIDAFLRIYKEEGFRALYKGLGPRLLRLAPGQSITWCTVEQFRLYCDNNNLLQ